MSSEYTITIVDTDVISYGIIDGDVIIHISCLPRWRMKAKIERGINYIDLNPDGSRVQYEFTDEEDLAYLDFCWDTFLVSLERLKDDLMLDCEEYVMAVKGDNNFRDELYPMYKKTPSRMKAAGTNPFIAATRQRAIDEGYAIAAHGMEADDLVRIWAGEVNAAGHQAIVCSIDKDLHCIAGPYFYMRKHEGPKIKIIESVHALKQIYLQILQGDSVDNIPGLPGIGPKTAEKLLLNCTNEHDMQEIVVSHYIGTYDLDWRSWLLCNGKLLYIMKYYEDHFRINHWPIVKELNELEGM
jgi:hypothetical protein